MKTNYRYFFYVLFVLLVLYVLFSLFGEAPEPAIVEQLRKYAATRADPAKTENKIAGLRRLWHDDKSENFFLEGCMTAAVKAAGGSADYDYMFFLTVGGTLFTQTYGPHCDGLASMPALNAAPHLFKQCGYSYLFVDRATIEAQPDLVFETIKTAIDKGIPVISLGVANLRRKDDVEKHHDLWCNIGGYGEDGVLYVNAYYEKDATDELGYFTARDGLAGSHGLYILLDKIPAPSIQEAYREALRSVPAFITMAPRDGVSFGKQAYHDWADKLEDKSVDWKGEGIAWKSHIYPWIINATIYCFMREAYFDKIIKIADCPEAETIRAKYMKIYALTGEIQKLFGGDFWPDDELLNKPEIRAEVAAFLRQMGDLHDDL